ncbi:hypothetical protein GCM10023191_071200 [Actinoallomurus oryzae]|uniref:Uncharacterized protein n=1 Tax=Actinoallomurus oryzae TaxID=502180 RepID=A0ABP8QTY4_9ACTN
MKLRRRVLTGIAAMVIAGSGTFVLTGAAEASTVHTPRPSAERRIGL